MSDKQLAMLQELKTQLEKKGLFTAFDVLQQEIEQGFTELNLLMQRG